MNEDETTIAPRDRSSPTDLFYLSVFLVIPMTPFTVMWCSPSLFVDLLSPILSLDSITSIILKLRRDLDAIAHHHFDYPPKPFIFTYFVALMGSTILGICLVRRNFRVLERPARSQTIMRWRPNSIWRALLLVAGLLMFLLWPWIGLSLLEKGGRSLPPGWLHDVFMIGLLFGYGQSISALPAMISLWFKRDAWGGRL